MRRHAPRTDDREHEEEHAVMMVVVNGLEARYVLHDLDARENHLPGRRVRNRARDKVVAHLTGPLHGLTIEAGAAIEDLLDQHEQAHR